MLNFISAFYSVDFLQLAVSVKYAVAIFLYTHNNAKEKKLRNCRPLFFVVQLREFTGW